MVVGGITETFPVALPVGYRWSSALDCALVRSDLMWVGSQLFARYHSKLVVFLRTRTGVSAEDDADLSMECFLTLLRKGHTFDVGRGSLRAWLYRIAMNKRFDHYRRCRKERLMVGALLDLPVPELTTEQLIVAGWSDWVPPTGLCCS